MSVGHGETTDRRSDGTELMLVQSSNLVMAGGCIRCQHCLAMGGLVAATVELMVIILLAAKAWQQSSSARQRGV